VQNKPEVILLVEDEPAHVEAILRALKGAGAQKEVQLAGSLQEYREAVTTQSPDIVLMDMNLPDGRAVEILTSPPENGAFPVLIMTSYGNEQIAVEAMKAGALDYIVKSSASFAAMPRTIERALREWRLLQERKRVENALRDSENHYRLLAENISDVIWVLDLETMRFRYVSPSVQQLRGYTAEEVIRADVTKALSPESSYLLGELIPARLEAAKRGLPDTTYCNEVEQPCRDGSTVWTEVLTKYILNPVNGHWEVYGTSRNITKRRQAEEKLKQSLDKLRRAIQTTIQVLVLAVETKDPYTAGHQRRMTNLARAMATEMGLPPEQIEGIRMAGIVHDIGKISLPAEILSKPTKLTGIEYSLVQGHVRGSYDILKDVESPWPLAEIAYQHHERMDGSGYPRGLKGAEILIEARILAVADVVEAVASYRPYRPALGIDAALREIVTHKGTLYDPEAVDACLQLFREKNFRFEADAYPIDKKLQSKE